MGVFFAKQHEEEQEYQASRVRAAKYLERCSPTYMEDLDFLGLSQDEEDDDYDGDVTTVQDDTDDGASKQDAAPAAADDRELEQQQAEVAAKDRAKEMIAGQYRKLLEYAAFGRRWKVQYIISKPHININHRDHQGRSAIFVAAERGHHKVVDVLVRNRAKVDNQTNAGWSPLHAATFHGHVLCIDMLLEAGADINKRDQHNCTALTLAASSPKLYLVDLVSRSDRRRRRHLRAAAFQKQMKIEAKLQKKKDAEQKSGAAAENTQLGFSDPYTMWKYYPNRIELLVMNALLKKRNITIDARDDTKRTPLIYAARYGRIYAASRLLGAKANVKAQDHDARTPLFHAACNGHQETMNMLLRAGGSVNATDQYFRTALHGAMEMDNEAMATTLLKVQASVNAYDCEGRTPIMLAMDQGNRRLFSTLIESKANLNVLDRRGWNVVIYSVETGMLNEVLPILAKAGEKAKPIVRAYDPQGRNSMHHAAMLSDAVTSTHAIESLLKLDPESSVEGDCNGDTAVHMAADLGRLDAVRLFSQYLGALDFKNRRGETPLMHAAHGGHLACVVALVEDRGHKGPAADAGMVDGEGRNVLMHACVSGHLDLVNLLVQNKEGTHPTLRLPPIDINQGDNNGVNALMVAAGEGFWQLLPSLVLGGASRAAKDHDGFTALHIAATEDEALAASCLLDLGLDANATDGKGWTPLMHAAAKGADEVVRLLVDCDAQLDARNWDGDTALQICARRSGNAVTKDLLTDGLLERDTKDTHSVAARGNFMFSVLAARDLYHEGKADQINAYVMLEFCPKWGMTPMIAYTSCIVKDACPVWNESFRFEVDSLHPSGYLAAWVLSAPGMEPEDIVAGAQHGLSEEQLQKIVLEKARRGDDLGGPKPEFNTAINKTFHSLKKAQDRQIDFDHELKRKQALIPMEQIGNSHQRHDVPFDERTWNDVKNLRRLLKDTGCEISDPLVPRTHLPLGVSVVRFRHLRAAVWNKDPVVIDRRMRLCCRGWLRLEIDFRPQYWETHDPYRNVAIDNGSSGLRTPREQDLIQADTKRPPTKGNSLIFSKSAEPPPGEKVGGRYAGIQDPIELYRRFLQISVWSKQMLDVRNRVGSLEEDDDLLGPRERGSVEDGGGGLRRSPPVDAESGVVGSIKRQIHRWKTARQRRELMEEAKDRPLEAATEAPRAPLTKAGSVQPGIQDRSGNPVAVVRPLQIEPWLEDLVESSRLI